MLHSDNSWRINEMAVVKDLWDIFAAQHIILGAHALELYIYVEREGCSMSSDLNLVLV